MRLWRSASSRARRSLIEGVLTRLLGATLTADVTAHADELFHSTIVILQCATTLGDPDDAAIRTDGPVLALVGGPRDSARP